MLTLLKFLRSLIKAITSSAAPWQMGIGAGLGILLGFMPIFPSGLGPSPLAFLVILVAIVINCHLGSVLLFMGLGKLLGLALLVPAAAIGNALAPVAAASADIPFLHHSHWSHTGYLGLTILGLACAPIVGAGMWGFTIWFRTRIQAKLAARRKLTVAGKLAGNPLGFKVLCWFMGL
jgi:uncharacterized protein (TIGR03546 family)